MIELQSFSFLLDFPTGNREAATAESQSGDPKQVLIIADGQTEQEAESRARAAAWLGERCAARLLGVVGKGEVPAEYADIATNLRGKEMFHSGWETRLLPLPSRFTLLDRVNFHPKNPDFGACYIPVSIGQGNAIWEVSYAGRFEWLVFEYGQLTRSREKAIKIVKGLDHLRAKLLWMGPKELTAQEREELREIEAQL